MRMDSQLNVTRKRALRGVLALLALIVLTNLLAFTERRGFGREALGGALHGEGPTFDGGLISPEGPPPVHSGRRSAPVIPNFADGNRRFQLDQPWKYGGFTGGFGPRYVFRLKGCDSTRLWFRGYAFSVVPFRATGARPGSPVKTTF